MHSERRRGRSRSRILYYFRTPPGVRVGRSALDEEAIRTIEQHNPGLPFDWTRILKGEPAPVDARPRHEGPERRQRPRPFEGARAIPPPHAAPPPPPPPLEPVAEAAAEAVLGAAEPVVQEELAATAEREGSMAAQTRLGPEGVVRLRARYSEVLARISERVTDPGAREELKRQAERLNPDTWVTDDEVTAGLEQYEAVFESLRSVVGRRRRRRRRKGGAGASGSGTLPGEPAGSPGDDTNGGTDDEAGSE